MKTPLAAVLSIALAAASTAVMSEDVVDDTALLRSFESQFLEIHRAQKGISANEVRRSLKRQASFSGKFESTSRKAALSSADLYRKAKESTLLVGHLYLCGSCDKLHGSVAGGVLLSADGLVLTNYHVLDFDRAKAFGAMTADKQAFPIAEVIASSKKHDLALIRLEGATALPFLPLSDLADVGESVFLVSHPDSHFYTLTTGLISRYYLAPRSQAPRLQITAGFARGSSGCGVLNSSGQLVGLVTSTSSIYYTQEKNTQEDLQMVVNSCVPLSSIHQFLNVESENED